MDFLSETVPRFMDATVMVSTDAILLHDGESLGDDHVGIDEFGDEFRDGESGVDVRAPLQTNLRFPGKTANIAILFSLCVTMALVRATVMGTSTRHEVRVAHARAPPFIELYDRSISQECKQMGDRMFQNSHGTKMIGTSQNETEFTCEEGAKMCTKHRWLKNFYSRLETMKPQDWPDVELKNQISGPEGYHSMNEYGQKISIFETDEQITTITCIDPSGCAGTKKPEYLCMPTVCKIENLQKEMINDGNIKDTLSCNGWRHGSHLMLAGMIAYTCLSLMV